MLTAAACTPGQVRRGRAQAYAWLSFSTKAWKRPPSSWAGGAHSLVSSPRTTSRPSSSRSRCFCRSCCPRACPGKAAMNPRDRLPSGLRGSGRWLPSHIAGERIYTQHSPGLTLKGETPLLSSRVSVTPSSPHISRVPVGVGEVRHPPRVAPLPQGYLLILHQPQGHLVSTVEGVPAIHLSLESRQGPNRVLCSKSGGQHLGGLGHPHPKDERFED